MQKEFIVLSQHSLHKDNNYVTISQKEENIYLLKMDYYEERCKSESIIIDTSNFNKDKIESELKNIFKDGYTGYSHFYLGYTAANIAYTFELLSEKSISEEELFILLDKIFENGKIVFEKEFEFYNLLP